MVFNVIDIFEELFGEYRKHNDASCQVSYDCPLCDDDKHSGNLEINYESSIFKCWACCEVNKMQGRVPYLLKRFGNKDSLKNYLLLRPDALDRVNREHKEVVVTLPDNFNNFFKTDKPSYPEQLALAYLRDRRISDDMINYYNIGFCNKGKYFNRIIIPSYDKEGVLNYFIGRWFSKEKTKIKYLNPEAEKESMIFNENKINYDATIYLVEGGFDHIVIPNSIPLLGKYISPMLLLELYEKAVGNIVIVLDGEDIAYEDAKKLYKTLSIGKLIGRIKIVRPPYDEDPSSLFKKYGPKGLISVLRTARALSYDELY